MPRFITKKWIEVHEQSGETYSAIHIVVKGIVTVSADERRDRDEMNRQVIFKNMHHLFLAFQK